MARQLMAPPEGFDVVKLLGRWIIVEYTADRNGLARVSVVTDEKTRRPLAYPRRHSAVYDAYLLALQRENTELRAQLETVVRQPEAAAV